MRGYYKNRPLPTAKTVPYLLQKPSLTYYKTRPLRIRRFALFTRGFGVFWKNYHALQAFQACKAAHAARLTRRRCAD
nr:MAG TPA: hypothetical protein [Caudoviricetes sp.]